MRELSINIRRRIQTIILELIKAEDLTNYNEYPLELTSLICLLIEKEGQLPKHGLFIKDCSKIPSARLFHRGTIRKRDFLIKLHQRLTETRIEFKTGALHPISTDDSAVSERLDEIISLLNMITHEDDKILDVIENLRNEQLEIFNEIMRILLLWKSKIASASANIETLKLELTNLIKKLNLQSLQKKSLSSRLKTWSGDVGLNVFASFIFDIMQLLVGI